MALERSKQKEESSHLERVSEGVTQLRGALLDCISQMEALFEETSSLVSTEARRVEATKEHFEATVGALELELQEKEKIVREEGLRLKELEENLRNRILDLENLVKEKERLLQVRETEIEDLKSQTETIEASASGVIELREEDEVDPGEGKLEDGLERQTSAELERLRAELHEKDVILKAREMELRKVEESMGEKIKELEKTVKRQAAQKQKNIRLVSLIGTIDKRN